MLHKAVGTIREPFFLFTLRIQFNQVTGYIFNFALGTLFHFFPRTGPQFVQAGSFSFFALIFGNLVQGMNGNKYHILILISKFNHFLSSIPIRNAYQTAKTAYAMIYMYHKITRLKLAQLFQGQCHLTATCLVATKIIFMETVKNLMVCKEAAFQCIICKALM